MKRILVVQRDGEIRAFQIDHLAERWRKMGYEVVTHKGPEGLPPADIAILHVDQTVVPAVYREALADYPVVLNRDVLDISRIAYSELNVSRGDDYRGAVIVKTNANYGGLPERSAMKNRRRSVFRWRTRRYLDPKHYPIFSGRAMCLEVYGRTRTSSLRSFSRKDKTINIFYDIGPFWGTGMTWVGLGPKIRS